MNLKDAWEPYSPTPSNPWDLRKVGHLYRRAGFGATQAELDAGLLYPPQGRILATEIKTARCVAEVIFQRGLAGVERPGDLCAFIESQLYKPDYLDRMRV